MTVSVSHEDKLCFGAWSKGRHVKIEFASAAAGAEEGMTPSELVIAILGAGIGRQVAEYCQRAQLPYHGMGVQLHWMSAPDSERIVGIRAEITLPISELTLEQEATIMSIVRRGVMPDSGHQGPALSIVLNPRPRLPGGFKPHASVTPMPRPLAEMSEAETDNDLALYGIGAKI